MKNKKIDNIKIHFRKNKNTYITGSICLIIGIASGIVVTKTKPEVIIKNWRFWSPGDNINIVTTALEDRTNYAIPIKCLETGEVFGSIKRAANLLNLDQGNISRHLQGDLPHVKNLHFEKLSETV